MDQIPKEIETFYLQQHLDDADFIKPTILGKIMEYYKNARNKERFVEFEKELIQNGIHQQRRQHSEQCRPLFLLVR
jgi:hypothetical protein